MSNTLHAPVDALKAIHRYGGVLVQPRTVVASLPEDEGEHDGVWLSLLYLAAVGVMATLKGLASLIATQNLNGLITLMAGVGRILVVPIVVLVACETVLGESRSHRRGLCLVPLVGIVVLGHELAAHGISVLPLVPEVVGGLLSLALAWWIRPAIETQSETSQ